MPVTLRLRGIPGHLEVSFRDAIEAALEGDWTVTLSQSHLDGQWHLQLDGQSQRCRVVLPDLQHVRVDRLTRVLRELTTAAPARNEADTGARVIFPFPLAETPPAGSASGGQ